MSGLFKETKGDDNTSMGRLLSFITTIFGLLIFGGATFYAISEGQDIGSNVMYGAIFLVSAGLGAKFMGKFAERKKQ